MLLGAAFTAFSFIYLRRRRQEQFVCNEQISHAEHNLRYEAGDNLIMPRVEERRSNVYCEIKDERQFSTKLSFVPPNNRELNGPGPRSKEYNMYDHLHETNTAESGNVYSRTTPEPSVVSAHQGNNTASSRTDIDNLDKREDDLTSDGRSKEFPDEKEGTAIYFVLEKEIK
ncbi:uncharacterized protein LOC133187660 [Saccostrea echinata]|uniref:uncharacterized protein LOC133187660 n=1 Tax=Saccostrea echinata TaxID=191078 RepID=UPI002A7F9C25|nr:uncharacterized protein LOC133187660 [Saccostrea echinata]